METKLHYNSNLSISNLNYLNDNINEKNDIDEKNDINEKNDMNDIELIISIYNNNE